MKWFVFGVEIFRSAENMAGKCEVEEEHLERKKRTKKKKRPETTELEKMREKKATNQINNIE